MSVMPSLECQATEFGLGLAMQTIHCAGPDPSTGRSQKLLLIHSLIGSTVLQPQGTVCAEQQQRLGGTIRFNSGWQKIGHSSPRRCDHGHRSTGSRGESQGEKGC